MKRKLYTILSVLDILFFGVGSVLLICIPTVWKTAPIGVVLVWIALFLSAVTITAMLDILIGRYDDER
jgi:hypothetical protein